MTRCAAMTSRARGAAGSDDAVPQTGRSNAAELAPPATCDSLPQIAALAFHVFSDGHSRFAITKLQRRRGFDAESQSVIAHITRLDIVNGFESPTREREEIDHEDQDEAQGWPA